MVAGPVGLKPQPIHGYYQTIAALRELDKNAARRVDAGINKAAKKLAEQAQGLVVNDILSGFARQLPGGTAGNRRKADGGNAVQMPAVRSGIKVKRKRQRKRGNELRSFVVIANTTALGAIWEVAGRSSEGDTPQGKAMIRNITRRDGGASRTVWRAVDADHGETAKVIAEQIEAARVLAQSKINRA